VATAGSVGALGSGGPLGSGGAAAARRGAVAARGGAVGGAAVGGDAAGGRRRDRPDQREIDRRDRERRGRVGQGDRRSRAWHQAHAGRRAEAAQPGDKRGVGGQRQPDGHGREAHGAWTGEGGRVLPGPTIVGRARHLGPAG
jgi:hypothetical protein